MRNQFRDRTTAGRELAGKLVQYANRGDVIVLALPRGGAPVAFEVARRLEAPLDVFVVRKLGVPGHRELAMGAIATGGTRIINEDVVENLGISEEAINRVATREKHELERREMIYRGHASLRRLRDKTVILVDDGVATGATMRAAVAAIRKEKPARLVVAVPTASAAAYFDLKDVSDEVVVLMVPEEFHAVGEWYEDFSETTDAEVTFLLREARAGWVNRKQTETLAASAT